MVVELVSPGRRWGPVHVAGGFLDRLRGVHFRPAPVGALIRGRSVHGAFLRRALWAVGLDAEGRVVGCRLLRPWGVVSHPSAAAMLELPSAEDPPPVGTVLGWRHLPSLPGDPPRPFPIRPR